LGSMRRLHYIPHRPPLDFRNLLPYHPAKSAPGYEVSPRPTRKPTMSKDAKVWPLHDLIDHVKKLRQKGLRIVQCHGVFDLLHIGHIRHFEQAKKLGDILVVTLTPDRFVNKGAGRPAFPENLRAEVIASLDCVNYVAVNHWPSAVETIKMLQPDIFAKGDE